MSDSVLLYISIIMVTIVLAYSADRLNCRAHMPCLNNQYVKVRHTNKLLPITKILLFLMFLIPWFFLAFRGNSRDLENYVLMFQSATSFGNVFSQGFDTGYFFLNYFVRLFTDNFLVFSCLISFLTLFLPFYAFWKLRNKISFTVLVSFYMGTCYLQAFNLVRIYLALSVIIFSSQYLFNRKLIRFYIGVFIAFLFHNSAIICVLMAIPFFNKKLSLTLIWSSAFVMIWFWLQPQIFIHLIPFERYQHYLQTVLPIVVGYVQPVASLAFISIVAMNYKKLKEPLIPLRYLAYSTFLLFIINMIGFRIDVFGRFAIYFYPLFGYGFGQLIKCIKIDKNTRMLICIYVTFYCLILTYLYFYSYLELDGLEKYLFFWSRV